MATLRISMRSCKQLRSSRPEEGAGSSSVLKPSNTFGPLTKSALTRSSPKRPIQPQVWPALLAGLPLGRADEAA